MVMVTVHEVDHNVVHGKASHEGEGHSEGVLAPFFILSNSFGLAVSGAELSPCELRLDSCPAHHRACGTGKKRLRVRCVCWLWLVQVLGLYMGREGGGVTGGHSWTRR